MDINEFYSRKSQFATRLVGKELIIVPLKGSVLDMNELFTLNEVGSFIWEQINGINTENDIVKAVSEEFDVDDQVSRKDVSDFLLRLQALLLK
jgi:hypothetical protein